MYIIFEYLYIANHIIIMFFQITSANADIHVHDIMS